MMKSERVAQGLNDVGLCKRRDDFDFLAVRQEDEHARSFAGIVGHQPADDLGTLVSLYVEKHELSRNPERLGTRALPISNRSCWRPHGLTSTRRSRLPSCLQYSLPPSMSSSRSPGKRTPLWLLPGRGLLDLADRHGRPSATSCHKADI